MRMIAEEEDKAEVSMGPMIDCVFLLLIFFLVATMLKKDDRDIDITPPVSESAVKLKPDDNVLVIGIDKDGGLYYQGVETTTNELHENLKRIAIDEPDKRIRLDADEATPFHRVVEVLDICQFRGLKNVGIRTYDKHYNRR